MIPVRIAGTASLLTGRSVPTGELVASVGSARTTAEIVASTGIHTRLWIGDDETIAGLGARVLADALERAGMQPRDLARVVLVCSSGGDVRIPATVNALLEQVEAGPGCDGFDLNNACMGFLSGLDIGARSVATGRGPVAVVTVEALSRHIGPDAPRSYYVLGDAAAATILTAPVGSEGIVGHFSANDGAHRGTVSLAAIEEGRRSLIQFAASSREMTRVAVGALVKAAECAMADAGLKLADIDWVVPHQPNGAMLDHVIRELGVAEDRLVRVVHEIGSVGAASIPVGLDFVLRKRSVVAGQHILLFGVGAGMAYGAAIYRVGG